ncbi:glycoside hydrolase family 3 C-terminal domain-containing protein, partial [Natronoarchaeum mannanilyticum]|uniref:glycoside hydrolase family 3 C-terminal domain-containing protein n=1 Tax=Natronoarchaeum mannanilyticum TaxID=926360 RepID=UPI003615B912
RLPGEQDELVEAVAAAAEQTIVAVRSSGPVELPWREEVDAILETWYPGQVDGEALARVLYGDADPGGRLPVTVAPEGEYPATEPRQYPGVDDRAHYDEGVFVGYRHFDAADAAPTYPFGHGESYAAFEYGDATVEDDVARVDVENVADRAGREVVQAYVRPPETGVERPERELAGFAAVEVEAGDSKTVEIELSEMAFARYDEDAGWTVDEGTYEIEIGRSSRDVRSRVDVRR